MKALKSIFALTLALLVLISSTTFMVGMHFCMGEVKSISLFSKADQCRKEQQNLPLCHKHKQADCCQDKTIVHDGKDFKSCFPEIQIAEEFPFQEYVGPVIIAEVIPSSEITESSFNFYDPPLPFERDFSVELHVFLI
jgi:hypothetical protein